MRQTTFLRTALQATITHGWRIVSFSDGEGVTRLNGTIGEVLHEALQVEDGYVKLERNGQKAWIRIVWQGPDATYPYGEEVISDHTTNISDAINPLYEPGWTASEAYRDNQ